MAEINPPWRTSPLENIINARWIAADVLVVRSLNGSPQTVIQFLQKTPATLGAEILLTTTTNGPTPPDPLPGGTGTDNDTVTITSAYSESIDYKGNVTVEIRPDFFTGGTTVVKNFYNGKGTTKPSVPNTASVEGVSIGSDMDGNTYFVTQGGALNGRISKYDSDGVLLWRKERVLTRTAVNLDDNGKLIVANFDFSDKIEKLDEDGNVSATLVDLSDFGIEDVSKKGKAYIFWHDDAFPFPGIKGYAQNGSLLFTVPAVDNDGIIYDSIIAFGEDHIFVTGRQTYTTLFEIIGPGQSHTISGTHRFLLVFDANSGAQLASMLMGDDETNVYSGLNAIVPNISLYVRHTKYEISLVVTRNDYYPRRKAA